MKEALIVIDMQNDFIDGELGSRESRAIVSRVKAKIKKAKDARVIFTQDTHTKDYLSTNEGKRLPVEHCIKPSTGWEICPVLMPYAKEAFVVEKSAFGAPGLAQLVADAERVTIIGVCTDVCVISNAILLKAMLPETNIAVDASCCAGTTPESHARAIEAMRACQIEIIGEDL